ncbi:MAG: hypothetical protein QF463_15010 [Vicinamibacterales bacterium]|nr:hypothetical protein [Vicinamibacterales bacterium]MDP6610372.1 hypothetical protein [Vicinamibacterales bacterium]HAK54050.1 hypothetical protein [Acidobacteriota bacterium]
MLQALDDRLESMVEVVNDGARRQAPIEEPTPIEQSGTAAAQSWFVKTIGMLRKDLHPFERSSSAAPETDSPASVDTPPPTVAPEGVRPRPTPRPPRPASNPARRLAAWALRTDRAGPLPVGTSAPAEPADDADGLLRTLSVPAPVALVAYPSGCRIQRVRIAKRDRSDEPDGDAPVVILSKQLLQDVREQSPSL